MTEKTAQREKKIFGLSRRWRRGFLAVFFLLTFLFGYNLTVSWRQQCSAQVVPAAPTPTLQNAACPVACTGTSCEAAGTAAAIASALQADLLTDIDAASVTLENFLYAAVNNMMQSEYIQLEWAEQSMIDWWNTMWYYNLLPGLQSMTRQLNTDLALQTFMLQANADATSMMEVDRALSKHEIDDHALAAGGQVCIATTAAGGYTRATTFSNAMRQNWENDSLATGLNTFSAPGGAAANYGQTDYSSATASNQQNYNDYLSIFCDPNANSGSNNCPTYITPALVASSTNPLPTNADVEVIKYLYNALTIPVNSTAAAPNGQTQGANMSKAVEDLIDNMVGLPAANPVLPGVLSTTKGQETYLSRRSYLARYAAIRSVPDMVAGWRMPGSQMGLNIDDLRQSAGIPLTSISTDPSYKEIMHALSVDRFNSGKYAAEMMSDPNKVEMEKLNLSVLYLMQLRDYYELLERTALTLSVQVSVMAGQQGLADVSSVVPLK